MKHFRFYILVFFLSLQGIYAQTGLVHSGSLWKYWDKGTDLGTNWREANFHDSTWNSGISKFGYGNENEATLVSFGPNSRNKYVTTYFRKNISLNSISPQYQLNLKRDDGIVVYVNGVSAFAANMPANYDYLTLATSSPADNGNEWISVTISGNLFQLGENTLAVEVHQVSKSSSDLSFDMDLRSATHIARSPYLQMGGSDKISILWTSQVDTDTRLRWGTEYGTWTDSLSLPSPTLNHEVNLSGLLSDTKYFYSILSTNLGYTIEAEDSALFFFQTAPLAGTSERKIKIWAVGDCGIATANQLQTMASYQKYMGEETADAMILLGDNAYYSGFLNEYDNGFFSRYKDFLAHTKLYPATGNHDYAHDMTKQMTRNMPYYDLFKLPANGELGGIPSGTEGYYSYDLGNVHFVVLDSYGLDYSNESGAWHRFYDTLYSPQISWLKQDLRTTKQTWKVVYFHHPPYTFGTHNSDTEPELTMIHSQLNKVLEDYGVDLVVNGHSHTYERSFFLHGHYGNSQSFSPAEHTVSTSSAHYDGSPNSCPYIRNGKAKGTVYVVAGSSAMTGGNSLHPAMYYYNKNISGTLMLEVQGNKLEGKFLTGNGVSFEILDQFTFLKDVNKDTLIFLPNPGTSIPLHSSWQGNHLWNTGETTPAIQYTGANNLITVRDDKGCLEDRFRIEIAVKPEEYLLFPNPSDSGIYQLILPNESFIEVHNSLGQLLYSSPNPQKTHSIHLENAPSGTYFLTWKRGAENISVKLLR